MSIPALSAGVQGLQVGEVIPTPFPAPTKYATGFVNGTHTNVSSIYFADKIMIIISQEGRLSQWIHVPMSQASPTAFDTALPSEGSDMLPHGHLTPKTLLGAGGDERETMGQLYATQIASAILTKNPEETRTVLVGFGIQKIHLERETFFDILELVQKVT